MCPFWETFEVGDQIRYLNVKNDRMIEDSPPSKNIIKTNNLLHFKNKTEPKKKQT